MDSYEVNFDGLVGPTHNYGGLSIGNLASTEHQKQISNPKKAALQGLEKMKYMLDLGLKQGVIAPQFRPDIETLRKLGFSGSDSKIISTVAQKNLNLLSMCYSASNMWTANAATVSPSSDTLDGKVHFTAANLVNKFHRSFEHKKSSQILKIIFRDEKYFKHHDALPLHTDFSDEGAANHTRFCKNYGDQGISFFVYGKSVFNESLMKSKKFSARQTKEASEAIVRQHGLSSSRVIYAQQNPYVIDQGVFHNDVIAVGNQNLLLCHEHAYVKQERVYKKLKEAFNGQFRILEVQNNDIPVHMAVQSYLFNSQIVLTENRGMIIVVPEECQKNKIVLSYLENLISENNPIQEFKVFNLKQSMNNGGGPACLRLRVVLNKDELNATNQSCILDISLYEKLKLWINKYYRDRIIESDFKDPALPIETMEALDELSNILNLGNVYNFQKN